MKSLLNTLMFLFLTILIASCDQQNGSTKSENANDTTGTAATKNLNGVASFIIDKSTYEKTLSSIKNEIRTDKEDRYKYRENRSSFPSLDDHTWMSNSGLTDNETRIYLESVTDKSKKQNPDIKRIEISYPGYYIGNLEISNLKLTFFKDTLISIECDKEDIESAFTKKYKPNSTLDETTWKTWHGETKIRPSENAIKNNRALLVDSREEKIWENEKVKATAFSHYSWKYKNKEQTSADGYSYFRMETKNQRRRQQMTESDNSIYTSKEDEEKKKEQESLKKL
jgi:hypothetical protein